jgi:hypothetical protein
MTLEDLIDQMAPVAVTLAIRDLAGRLDRGDWLTGHDVATAFEARHLAHSAFLERTGERAAPKSNPRN